MVAKAQGSSAARLVVDLCVLAESRARLLVALRLLANAPLEVSSHQVMRAWLDRDAAAAVAAAARVAAAQLQELA